MLNFSVPKLDCFVKNIDLKQIHCGQDRKAENQKKFYKEELLPLNQYIQSKYNDVDEHTINICQQHESHYDAYITSKNNNIVEYIQITCAIHDHSYALVKEAIAEQELNGKIHDMLADNRENADKAYDKNLPKTARNNYREIAKFTPEPYHALSR